MKVVLINRSDWLGGAAKASFRLMNALQQQGVDARMLVVDRHSDSPQVAVVGTKWGNRYLFLAERLGIFLHNGLNRDTLFQIDTATHGVDVSRHPWVLQADAIILNWINQGTMSLRNVQRLADTGKPLLWTMHDMWNCTGVCHIAYDCTRYQGHCSACPLTGKTGDDLSTRTQRRKAALYDRANIHFVAVSHWLADCCHNSALMNNAPITVVGNPLDIHTCNCTKSSEGEGKKFVVAMGAARLDDHVKGLDLLIETTQHIATERPQLAQRLHLLLYGNIRDHALLDRLAVPHTYTGYVDNVSQIYRQADAVLSASHYESFGYTLIEGMAHGCIPVTTGEGGQVDIVRHRHNGYVTGNRSPQALADGIEWAMKSTLTRQQLHEDVLTRFDTPIIAQRYISIIQSLTK